LVGLMDFLAVNRCCTPLISAICAWTLACAITLDSLGRL
jgi:hypothetical protein